MTLAIGLVGVMTLFLGLMKVAEAGGLLSIIARLLRPLMQRLFPQVPPTHPAMGAMILNMSVERPRTGQRRDAVRHPRHAASGRAQSGEGDGQQRDGAVPRDQHVERDAAADRGHRAAGGRRIADPAGILPTTLFATICSTAVAIVLAKVCERWWPMPAGGVASDGRAPRRRPRLPSPPEPTPKSSSPTGPRQSAATRGYPGVGIGLALCALVLLIPLTIFDGRDIAPWIIPGLVVGLLAFGAARGVRVYESFVEGARDGFQVAVRIIPYLVAILVAVGMLRASGALDLLIRPLGAITAPLGLPAEALLMGMLRALSGSGAFAYLASLLNDPAIGPDSYTGYLVSTIQGSTETTFYVLAVYFGAVGVERMRHAVVVGLAADAAGVARLGPHLRGTPCGVNEPASRGRWKIFFDPGDMRRRTRFTPLSLQAGGISSKLSLCRLAPRL